MNEFSRSSRVPTAGSPTWLLPVIAVGILAGIALRFFAPDILTQTAIIGQIFGGILLIVAVPLVTSQLALALNNPRDRVRRGVSHSKILVQVVIPTAILLIVTAVFVAFFTVQDSRGFAAVLLQHFNPVELVNFSSSGGGYVFLGIALLIAAVLGVMGDKAQEMVTICGRISRASIRTFRLAMWLAPIGLLSMVGTLGSPSQESSSALSLTALALFLTATTGLLLYSTIVLGIDWIVGQLRPARKDGRRFERTSRVGQRPTTGRPPTTSRPGSASSRPVSRPTPDSRRDRERSPFDMGVSSTPVLDIASPNASSNAPSPANAETGRRNDFRARPNRDSQSEPPRTVNRGAERETSTDSPRPGYRDRGPRPERREGTRDGYRDRGPRGPRPDRPDRDRGPRPDRFDRSQTARSADQENSVSSSAPVNRSIDPATAAADLAKVREQLNQSPQPQRESPATPQAVTPESNRPERTVAPSPAPERIERPAVSQEQPAAIEQVTTEMHYGRSRHRKHERPETESRPGVEPPPMPEMVDHYSTDDMAFGRGKRKKTVK